MLHHPPTSQESRQPPPKAPPGAMPPPTPVAPPPRTRTRKRRNHSTPEPMLLTQETATSAETALSQGEHQGPYPTMVQRITDLLHKPQELMTRQKEDSHLLGKVRDLNNGGTAGEYVTHDDGLLWYAPPRFHPTPGHPPLPGTRHPGIRPHNLWPPRSSTDYRADAKKVPLDITQKRRPRLRAFLRVPKAQKVHQPARRHAASPLSQAPGSPRDGHPRHVSEV